MSGRRSRQSSGISDDQIIELVSKLHQLLPQIHNSSRSNKRRRRWRLLAVEQIGGCSNQVPHSSSAAGESVRYNRNVAVVCPSFTQRQSHFFFYFVLCPPLLFCPEIIISPTDEFEATSSCERRNSYLFPAGLLIAVHKDYFRVTNNKKLLLDDFGDSVLNYCMSS